uniref:Probable pectate lyase F n=1 Tax=Ditylenchus dipsaci TaxID=166011 RepID=A0A915DWM2_9BILA
MLLVIALLSNALISVILLPGAFAPPATTPAPPAAGTGAPPAAATGGGGGGACKYDPFPTPTNCEVVKATIKVAAGATFDGKDKCYTADKALGDGGQGEGQKPIIEVADGGTVSNVVFGKMRQTVFIVWDLAKLLILGGLTLERTLLLSRAKALRFQFKEERTVSLNGVKTTNITADLVAINPNYGDTATIKNLTMVGGSKKPVCLKTEGNDTKAEPKKMGDGPDGKSCIYTEADVKTA